MSWIMWMAQARAPRMATEAVFALAVRVFVAIGLTAVPPDWAEKWEDFRWRNMILLFLSVLLIPLVLYGIHCGLGVDIPEYSPDCNVSGLILDALYPGILAYLFNYVGEDMYRRSTGTQALRKAFFNQVSFWLFVAAVVVEFALFMSGLSLWASFGISVIAALLLTLVGLWFAQAPVSSVAVRFASAGVSKWVWVISLALKIAVSFLPIPWYAKALISAGLAVMVFLLTNYVFGRGM